MRLVALEKLFRRPCPALCGIHPIHRPRSARSNIKPPGRVEGQVPDVVRLHIRFPILRPAAALFCLVLSRMSAIECSRVKDHGSACIILLGRRVGLQPVDLAAGQRSRIERSIRSQPHHLHAQVFALEQRKRLAVRSHPQHCGWRGGSQVGRAIFVHGHRPHIARRRGEHLAQRRPLAQMAVAGQRNPLRRALFKILQLRLGPQVSALRKCRLRSGDGSYENTANEGKTPSGANAANRLVRNIHAAVESTKVGGS